MKDLRGVYPPAVTFFDAQGNPDLDAAKKHTDYLIDAGVDGIAYFGTSGEFFALSLQEKKEYLETMIRHVDGRVNVLAGVGDTSIVNTLDLLAFAEQAGADGALIVNPYYCVFEEAMVEAYYSKLAESTKLPIVIYNFPGLTGFNFPPELVERLALKHRNIVGIKETIGDAAHVQKMIDIRKKREDFIVYCAFENQAIGALLGGARGFINGSANFAPEYVVGIWRTFRDGDLAAAAEYHKKLTACMDFYTFATPLYMSLKQAVYTRVLGRNCGERLPALPLPPETRRIVYDTLKRMELIDDEVPFL